MADYDPISQNIAGVQSLVGSKINKINSGASEQQEGAEGEFVDELTLKLDDAELLTLANKWEGAYRGYESELKIRQQANKAFYLGKQKEGSPYGGTDGKRIDANLLFEAVQTFIPAALAKNPEPVVYADNSKEGNELSNVVKTMLQYHADVLVLRRKLTLVVNHWTIYFTGIMKHGWDDEIQDIKSEVRDPRNFIFDPEGYVDCYGDFSSYLGERITLTADKLINLFPKYESFIRIIVNDKLGTDVTYTEWWNDDYCFYTFKGRILDKNKNPLFNYSKENKTTNDDGSVNIDKQEGKNHFARPKKPYTFLSVFSFGEQPHDVTGLIEQNIPNQRRVTRRTEQIDFNLSRQNNSDIFSEDNFNQETAKQAATAIAKGHPVIIPKGRPLSEAIVRLQAQGIDNSFFTELENSKNDLRQIFGTQGLTAQQPNEDTTARGMILNQQYDNSRIGGGIGDALEQFADNVFNWWVQLYYVYYDENHEASILGTLKATEYVVLSQQNLGTKLVVSVSPNSMKPRDEITQINQAVEYFQMGVIGPKTLLTIANFPDPDEAASDGILYKMNPQAYLQLNYPEVFEKLQQLGQPTQAGTLTGGEGQPVPPVPAEPSETLSVPEANPSLSNVPIPK